MGRFLNTRVGSGPEQRPHPHAPVQPSPNGPDVRAANMPALAVDGLSLAVDGAALLSDISLTVGRGEMVGLVGESGSGKTLTGLSILGLAPHGARLTGSIRVSGVDMTSAAPAVLRQMRGGQVGMIFQEPRSSLNPALPVGRQIADVVRAHLEMTRKQAGAAALSLLGQVGLPSPRTCFAAYPHELSGGMCQRVMIAMALSCGPTLLIADEPTTALDVTVQAQIITLLRSIADERGLSVLLITHNLAVVTQVCDRVITMYCGQVVNADTTARVLSAPSHPYTWALLEAGRVHLSGADADGSPRELTGQPASPAHPPQGCRFHPRCPFAEPRCAATVPELTAVDGGQTRCVRQGELSLAAGQP
jgi:peptide/nickel transport system ATP-binding protein